MLRGHRVRVLMGLLALFGASASAQIQQYGDGHNGPLEVTEQLVINEHTPLSADAVAGDYLLSVRNTNGFSPGNAVLVVQMQYLADTERAAVGTFELHRLTRVRSTTIELESPVAHPFAAVVSQVITLPEYTSVKIAPDAGLRAPGWNGSGGIVAFLADGLVTNNGRIDASGAGFRGGTGQNAVDARSGCMGLDEPAPGGAERGEGAKAGGFGATFTGRGNNDTGGGGGVCGFSGGAGGGHRGEGGSGGFGLNSLMSGGLPGASLTGRGLVLGGGGGAANGLNANPRNGGTGGGIVYIGARDLTGRGVIAADGLRGGSISDALGAASGGGAGGTVWLEIANDVVCQISATGGSGGNTVSTGPGGGGGGGLIRLQAQVVRSCTTAVSAGMPGFANQAAYGAGPISPDVAPNSGAIDVTDVYGEEIPLPEVKQTALIGVGCGCDASGAVSVWLALGAWVWVRRRR